MALICIGDIAQPDVLYTAACVTFQNCTLPIWAAFPHGGTNHMPGNAHKETPPNQMETHTSSPCTVGGVPSIPLPVVLRNTLNINKPLFIFCFVE